MIDLEFFSELLYKSVQNNCNAKSIGDLLQRGQSLTAL